MADGTRACDGGDKHSTASPEDRRPLDRIAEANRSRSKDMFLGEDSLVQRYRQTSTPGDSLPPSAPSFSFKRYASFALQNSVSH